MVADLDRNVFIIIQQFIYSDTHSMKAVDP